MGLGKGEGKGREGGDGAGLAGRRIARSTLSRGRFSIPAALDGALRSTDWPVPSLSGRWQG